MPNSPSEPIEYGDEDYTTVYNEWVTNGRSARFDLFEFTYQKTGKAGSAIFHVLDVDATYPTIYMVASWEFTTHTTDSAREAPTQKGVLWASREDWLLRGGAKRAPGNDAGHIWEMDRNKFTVPNELAD